jgi:hypothetical protein
MWCNGGRAGDGWPDLVLLPQVTEHQHDFASAAAVGIDSVWTDAWAGGGARSEARDSIGRFGEALVCRLTTALLSQEHGSCHEYLCVTVTRGRGEESPISAVC